LPDVGVNSRQGIHKLNSSTSAFPASPHFSLVHFHSLPHGFFMQILRLLLLPLLLSTRLPAQNIRPGNDWDRAMRQRLDPIVAKGWRTDNGNRDPDVGKWTWSPFLANVYANRNNPERMQAQIQSTGASFINSRFAGSFEKPFSCPGYSMYYFQFYSMLPEAQKARAKQMLQSKGFDQTSRTDGKMDPIYDLTEFNSENFNWMSRMAGLQWAYALNDAPRKAFYEEHLDNLTRALFNAGRVEWNSNNYWGHCMNPVIVLATHAPTEKIRAQATAIADWMVFEAAIHYLDGFQVGPDVRAKTNAYKPFAGSVWPYTYLYFQTGFPTSFSQEAAKKDFGKSEVGLLAYSTYRPPQVAIDIAQRKFPTPVEIQSAKPFYHLDNDNYADWQGNTERSRRFEFETLYLERDYTLASLATLRPNGIYAFKPGGREQKPFSEQNVWRWGVKGRGNGALQVFGNAGPEGGWGNGWDTMAQRQPWEQIGQYHNVIMRLFRNLDRAWVAIPVEAKTVTDAQGRLFVDMGHGVYGAFLPYNGGGLKQEAFPFNAKKNETQTHHRFIWTLNPQALSALVLEVGTQAEHGSFDGFRAAIAKSGFSAPGANQLGYRSSTGNVLGMEHTGVTTYKMVNGDVVDPAGKLPRVWRDGKEIDFSSWDSYQVSHGFPLIQQKWGSGTLTARSDDHTLQIQIDPATAQVQYTRPE
jgi:hypothetical protein